MAKKKAAAQQPDDDLDFFTDLAEETGGEVLDKVDSVKYFIDTGNLAINFICSGQFITGGIPGGKLTEIYGPSASSKSLLGTNILFGCQKLKGIPILLDTENAANKDFIKLASHCDLARLVRSTPQTLERAFSKIYKMVEYAREKKGPDVPIVVVLDSISVLPCERELREVDLPENYTQAEFKRIVGAKEQPGERAKVCSRELRKLNSVMEKFDCTVIVMNQTRSKIGVLYGNPETTAGGGNALPFYASCRLRPSTAKKIEKKIGSRKKIIGVNIRMANKKNRTHRPFVESDGIQLLFDKGINPLGGLLSLLLEAERIKANGSGNYVVNEPWAAGADVTFKASMEKNTVPLEVLLQCPLLIDAKTEQEVKDYLAPFGGCIDFLNSDDLLETSVEDEEGTDAEVDDALG